MENLYQCEYCGYVSELEDIPRVNDPWSDGTVMKCPECNEGESFINYDPERAKRLEKKNDIK